MKAEPLTDPAVLGEVLHRAHEREHRAELRAFRRRHARPITWLIGITLIALSSGLLGFTGVAAHRDAIAPQWLLILALLMLAGFALVWLAGNSAAQALNNALSHATKEVPHG